MEVSDGNTGNSDKRDDIIQRPMGVKERGTEKIKLVSFIRVIVARVGVQDRRDKANAQG